jgi:hypothetical protein
MRLMTHHGRIDRRAAAHIRRQAPMNHRDSAVPGISPAAWLLLAGAGIVLAVHVARDWYQLFGPYLIVRPQMMAEAVQSTAPFLIGATILIGMGRWPAGRRWLVAGAVTLGVLGVIRLGSEIAVALWMGAPTRGPLETAMIVLALGASLAAAAAAVMVALGLHAARIPGPERRWPIVGLALVGGVALLGAVIFPAVWISLTPDRGSAVLLALPHGLLQAVTIGATVVIAIAAVRAAPRHGAIPEWLIAIGAVVGALVIGWQAWFQVLVAVSDPDELIRYQALWANVPLALSVLGVLFLAIGFALGRVFPVRQG